MLKQSSEGSAQDSQAMQKIFTDMITEQVIEDKVAAMAKDHNPLVTNPQDDPEEDEAFVAAWREKRMAKMEAQRVQVKNDMSCKSHGEYREVTEEEFLPAVTGSKKVVCHFYHGDFERCKIMDNHLRIVAPMHPETRFITINAEKAPFFVQKLAIQTLPTLVLFQDGVAKDRIMGFEGISGDDSFETIKLARKLVKCKMIKAKTPAEDGIVQRKASSSSEDSDFD